MTLFSEVSPKAIGILLTAECRAVSFLLHCPYLQKPELPKVPRVTRHTDLLSSDFPLAQP